MADAKRKTPSSPQAKPTTEPAPKSGDSGEAKTATTTKIKSGSKAGRQG